ncbi:MAG: polysaccharide deacetylase family protein [Spirochaetaceae bacterium]|jgi:peptidoglycan/xylan/chitin deacetylase (PgdA/CDA1 family)|nr:polysaccharide deacetylase family protein [Spirochaetaceae bacterium]
MAVIRNARAPLLLLWLVLFRVPLAANVNFSGLDLSSDNRLLFGAESGAEIRQGTLYITALRNPALRQLTAFPEKMEPVDGGKSVQIRNAFGVIRMPLSGGLPAPVPGLPGIFTGGEVTSGRAEGMAASADGKWLLIVEPSSAAYGNLALLDTATGQRTLVASDVERPGVFPASWSPDSRVFVYERSGRLYYHTTGSASHTVDERYRLIGEGSINAVRWNSGGDFFYIRGATVFRVRGAELFARAVYADFLEPGQIAGKIPFEFDSNFDEFWIAPDARTILLAKSSRNLFFFPLGLDDYSTETTVSRPWLLLPRSCGRLNVLWPARGAVTIIAQIPGPAGASSLAWRFDPNAGDNAVFTAVDSPVENSALLSPGGTRMVCWGEQGVFLYDYAAWRPVETLSANPGWSCFWLGANELVAGDSVTISRFQFSPPGASPVSVSKSLVCLSQAGAWSFEAETGRVLARAGAQWYATDGETPWEEIARPAQRPTSQVSEQYRVYLERQYSGPYANMPMIRNTVGTGTAPLFQRAVYSGDPGTGAPREVAICFDLYDDAAGLPLVLHTLRDFGIRATFFINGEFIRRYPGAVKDIVEAGHETASMFFVSIDLSDARYRIDETFISRGLARNEDEFFKVSGREMSLLWHAPHYAISENMVTIAARSGYSTIHRDVDPLDWVTRENTRMSVLTQLSALDMIDRIMSLKQNGSVIPIRLGLLPGGRGDYLYNRLGLLLDAIAREGYTVVPVSTLIERRRQAASLPH